MFEGLGDEPTVILCGASVFLIVSHYQGSAGFLRSITGTAFDAHPWNGVLGHFWWFGSSITLYLVMPLLLALATKGSFNERYGFQLGDWRAGLKIAALFLMVMLPATYVASTMSSFKGAYPLAGNAAYMVNLGGGKTELSWTLFITYELAYFSYFIAWEFLFRGWMVHGITPKWGRAAAILVQVAPFAVMHLGKPELETLGSIIAGVGLGMLSMRTRSFYYGALIHGVVAVWMDWLSASGALLGS
jgi:membrane protease YdiL (CAAX protease family)